MNKYNKVAWGLALIILAGAYTGRGLLLTCIGYSFILIIINKVNKEKECKALEVASRFIIILIGLKFIEVFLNISLSHRGDNNVFEIIFFIFTAIMDIGMVYNLLEAAARIIKDKKGEYIKNLFKETDNVEATFGIAEITLIPKFDPYENRRLRYKRLLAAGYFSEFIEKNCSVIQGIYILLQALIWLYLIYGLVTRSIPDIREAYYGFIITKLVIVAIIGDIEF